MINLRLQQYIFFASRGLAQVIQLTSGQGRRKQTGRQLFEEHLVFNEATCWIKKDLHRHVNNRLFFPGC